MINDFCTVLLGYSVLLLLCAGLAWTKPKYIWLTDGVGSVLFVHTVSMFWITCFAFWWSLYD